MFTATNPAPPPPTAKIIYAHTGYQKASKTQTPMSFPYHNTSAKAPTLIPAHFTICTGRPSNAVGSLPLYRELFCSSETCVSEDEDEDDEDENNEGGNEEVDDLLYEEKECEELELRGKNLYEAIESESVVALYTPTNVSEHFYLCYVIEKCIAGEDIQDNSINQHDVLKGSMYLRCKYYKKEDCESKGFIHYTLLDEIVYVLPHQVVYPFVSMDKKGCLTKTEYQFICDCQ